MKKLNGNFTIVPNDYINDNRLDAYEFRILCYLLKLADENCLCFPSYQTLSRATGISISKVKISIKHLVEIEIIAKENQFKDNGSAGSNHYVVCEKDYAGCSQKPAEQDAVSTDTTSGVSQDLPCSISDDAGSVCESYNQYTNINTNSFINNHHLSIERILEQAEIDNLKGQLYMDFKSAIEKMYHQKSISVCGQNIPQANVRKRLQNISYEHIVHVDNNMPRKILDGKIEIQVVHKVPYIMSSLYDCLQFSREQIIKMDYGDDTITDTPNDTS